MSDRIGNGFVLVDKPAGWTSHDVVAKLRGLLGIKKVGHAGTLDPMATGLIVVGLRRATRLLRYVQAAPKEYVARAVFGVATDSLDADGAVLERTEMDFGEEELRAAMARFEGRIAQIPPMVSARKIGGKKLYELARAGIEVEREAREVFIHGLELVDFAPSPYPEVVFRTVCSTGTYVRTLADDIARALGGRAHLSALRRLGNGSLHVRNASQISELEAAAADGTIESKLLSTRDGLTDLPEVLAADPVAAGIRNGLVFPVTAFGAGVPSDGPMRIVGESGDLLAVYRVDAGKAAAEVVLG